MKDRKIVVAFIIEQGLQTHKVHDHTNNASLVPTKLHVNYYKTTFVYLYIL